MPDANGRWTSQDAIDAIVSTARQYGYSDYAIQFFLAVAYGESGMDPYAHGDVNIGGSYGIYQFYTNGGRGTGVPIETLYNPWYQAKVNLPILHAKYLEYGGDEGWLNNTAYVLKNGWKYGQGSIWPTDSQITSALQQAGAVNYDNVQTTTQPQNSTLVQPYQPTVDYLSLFPAYDPVAMFQGRTEMMDPIAMFSASIAPQPQPSLGNPVADALSLAYPIEDHYITSPWDARDIPEHSHGHSGVDFGTSGAPVQVSLPLEGTVLSVSSPDHPDNGYGLAVRVQHADGTVSLYAHMSSVDVAVGQVVGTGQPLGMSGGGNGDWRDGVSTGFHLHFGVYQNGVDVDPLAWLENTSATSTMTPTSTTPNLQPTFPASSALRDYYASMEPAVDPVASFMSASVPTGPGGEGIFAHAVDPVQKFMSQLDQGFFWNPTPEAGSVPPVPMPSPEPIPGALPPVPMPDFGMDWGAQSDDQERILAFLMEELFQPTPQDLFSDLLPF